MNALQAHEIQKSVKCPHCGAALEMSQLAPGFWCKGEKQDHLFIHEKDAVKIGATLKGAE